MNVKQPGRVYYDPDGHPLVYSQPLGHRRYSVTVNTRVKWYGLYLVDNAAGEVRELPRFVYEQFREECPDGVAMAEHVPTPQFCRWLERQDDLTWDEAALDLVVGRYVNLRHDLNGCRAIARAFYGDEEEACEN